jgi:hypothetical protein
MGYGRIRHFCVSHLILIIALRPDTENDFYQVTPFHLLAFLSSRVVPFATGS